MFRSVSLKVSLLAAFLLVPSLGSAQKPTGVLEGVVRDSSGARVPGAQVVANSPALIQPDLSVTTDNQGYYRLALLPPGRYELTFTLQGFQTFQRAGLIVNAGQTTTIDVTLSLEPLSETTTVIGSSPTLDQRRSQVSFSYEAEQVDEIPTARNLSSLLDTIPGVETTGNFGTYQRPGTSAYQSVLGAGERSSSYWLDGANTTDPAGQWNMQGLFPYDVVEEVQVLRAAKPAEAPFQGGLFQVVTKSGGNELQGNVAGYFMNDALQGDNAKDLREAEDITTSNRLKDDYELTAALGGRIVRDKLWWFGSARRQSGTTTELGFPYDVDEWVNSVSLKPTYQLNDKHRISGLVTRYQQRLSHYFFSLDPNYTPALAKDEYAASIRPLSGTTASVTWNGILSDNVLVDATFNRNVQEWLQQDRPGAGVAIIDLVTGERRQNTGEGSRDQDTDSWFLSGALSWFVPDAAGRHDVKVGLSYFPTRTRILFDDLGHHRLNTVFGRPRIVRFLSTPSEAIWDNDLTSAYIQDSWTIKDRLTLNYGLRFDHTFAATPAQNTGGGTFAGTAISDRFPALNAQVLPPTDLVDWSDIAPRFAATYSVDGAGKTVLRFGASRYYHNLESFGLYVSNPAFPFTFATVWTDQNADGAFQIGEDGPLLFQFGGQINPVDPNIERPYTNEFIVGVSHEPFADTQVSANFIYRKDRKLTATVDTGVPTDVAYSPVEVIDPGPDGIAGSGDDATLTAFARDLSTVPLSVYTLTNPAGNDRTYKGLEIVASRRLSSNWQAVASLIVSEMEVIKPTIQNSIPNLFDNPNGLINAKGLDPNNETVRLKLQGVYLAPWGITLSAFYQYGSGLNYTRQLSVELPQGPTEVFAETRGASKTDDTNQIDFRVEKQFRLYGGRLGLMLDVFNLTNSSTVVNYGKRTGIDYGQPQAVVFPRIARIGLRYTW